MWNFSTRLKHTTACRRYSALLLFFVPLLSWARANPPPSPPIEVASNFAEVDGKAGLATHFGQVVMSQGERRIFGNKLVVQRNMNGELDTLTASGYPARYEGQLREDEPLIYGKANRIHYFPQQQLLILEGDAEMHQENDAFLGDYITYNIEEKLILSEPNGSGRTTIIVETN